MALATVDGLLHLGNLLPAGNKSLTDTQATAAVNPGTMSFMNDNFGLRIMRYGRIMAAQTQGALVDRVALKTGTTTGSLAAGSNDTTHLTASAFAATAGDEAGKVLQVNVSGAVAPEGETGYVTANSATMVTLDPLYPLSVAAAIGATFSCWAINNWDDAAAGTNKIDVGGIVMGAPNAKDYGWCQIYGFHPAAQVDVSGGAPTAGAAGCSGTKTIIVRGLETVEDYLGYFPMATSTTAVQAGFVIDVFHRSQPIA